MQEQKCQPSAYRIIDVVQPAQAKGGHPTLAGGEVSSEVCFTRGGDCCKNSNNIKVKDCGSYFIYKLQKLPACHLRYCGTD